MCTLVMWDTILAATGKSLLAHVFISSLGLPRMEATLFYSLNLLNGLMGLAVVNSCFDQQLSTFTGAPMEALHGHESQP